MTSSILLVNPNRVHDPPVIPIGLEYVLTSLEHQGHNCELLDLCFSPNPIIDLEQKLQEKRFDIVGFSIRNIDSGTYFNNTFFLADIKNLIKCVKKQNLPVVLGGSGFSAMPQEVLEYLSADYGVVGPGEVAFPRFLDDWNKSQLKSKIYNGWNLGISSELVCLRGKFIDYELYLKNDGIIGFETQKGCLNNCAFCVEAKKRTWFKKISNVIDEIEFLVNKGFTRFHLCDSEFNIDLNYSLEFCKALIASNLSIEWALYMFPKPYNEELFKFLSDSGACLITLSVESEKENQASHNYSYKDLKNIINFCNEYNIQVAIDLLTGYPYESKESVREMIEFFKRNRPTSIGISFYYRIYKNTPFARLIQQDTYLQKNLTRPISSDENFLRPIFFHQYELEFFEELIAGDELFHIAGLNSGVNYQRVTK